MKTGFFNAVSAPATVVGAIVSSLIGSSSVLAAGKKRPSAATPPAPMVRAIQLDRIPDRYIELPDPSEPLARYGSNIYTSLVVALQKTNQIAVLLPGDGPTVANLAAVTTNAQPTPDHVQPDPCIINTPPVASSRISIQVNELSFDTGSRGERLAYGFKRGEENPYNAGVDEKVHNEFPLSAIAGQVNWFENIFNDSGGLHTGLELANEINFDILVVGAKLKREQYNASLGLDVTFQNEDGSVLHRQLQSTGNGFYFDLSANFVYQGGDYMLGAMVSRKTALLTAFQRTVSSAVAAIGAEVATLPLVSRLAAVCGGAYFVAAGANYNVPVGTRFYDLTQLEAGVKPSVFTASAVYAQSSSVSIQGAGFQVGDKVVSLAQGQPVPAPKQAIATLGLESTGPGASPELQTVDSGLVNIDLPDALKSFVESYLERLFAGLKATLELPYAIWRYFQYDQAYGGGELKVPDAAQAAKLATSSWAARSIGLEKYFAQCQGKDVSCLGSRGVIVAVIDSGVDYNHEELRRNIFWDGTRDQPGYDFVSHDQRPYDDNAHGTEVASVIAGGGSKTIGVAPNVTLLPIKVFSPYGVTSSAALYSAFEYAVSAGAKIIVTGWGTQRASKALEDGVKLAQANGLLVVAAAGDGGMDLEKRPYYPAAFAHEIPNMVVVAGYGQDGALTKAQGLYSNYGPGVDLAAPGSGVLVAQPRNHHAVCSNSGIASGFVAGAAALIWSRCPKISAQNVKTALLGGAIVLPSLESQVPGNKALSIAGALEQSDQICK